MRTFISILRGINVGGQRKILMADLKTLYEEQGFGKIITYIQSGNVIFQASERMTDKEAATKIESAIKEKFSCDVAVIVRTVEETENIISSNPFFENKELDATKFHVTLLSEIPDEVNLISIGKYDYSPDKFKIHGKDVYLYCPAGYGRTRLSNTFFENKLKVKATTRNWNTITKLFEIASVK